MKSLSKLPTFVVLSLSLVASATATDYDLVINNGRAMDPEPAFKELEQEARVIAGLTHPCIVTLHELVLFRPVEERPE